MSREAEQSYRKTAVNQDNSWELLPAQSAFDFLLFINAA